MLELRSPLVIGPRLLPALRIGDSWVYVAPEAPGLSETLHRTVFRVIVDTPDGTLCDIARLSAMTQDDPSVTVREAMRSAVAFLRHEGDRYLSDPDGDGWLFNTATAEWAHLNEDELSIFDNDFDSPKEDT